MLKPHQILKLKEALIKEKRRRSLLDEWKGRAEESLIDFIRLMWEFVEPAQEFVEGWAVEAICEHLEAVSSGEIRRILINVPPGFMKPVYQNTAVFIKNRGMVALKNVEIGDEILSHRGRWCKISGIHRQGVLPVLKLTTWSGRSVVTAHDHPFLTPDGWVLAQDLRTSDVLGVVPYSGEAGSQTISNEESRLLGYLVGDGCCSGTPNITCADDEETADIIKCVEHLGFVANEQVYRMTKTGYKLRRVSIKMGAPDEGGRTRKGYMGPVKRFLDRHNILGHNAYTKRIPQAVMEGNNSVVTNFLGAYWACDGCIAYRGGLKSGGEARQDLAIMCDSVNRALLEDIQLLLGRLGINSTIRPHIVKRKTIKQGDIYTSYRLNLASQDDCWNFSKRIVIHNSKYSRITSSDKRRFDFDRPIWGDPIVSIEDAGSEECMCLSVDDDHSFTANGFAVHNSFTCNVFWPAWEWARGAPSTRYLTAAYSQGLTIRDNTRFRNVIMADTYRDIWGDVFGPSRDQFSVIKVGNNKTGWKLASSVTGVGTGERADRVICDDPNSVKNAESQAIRDSTNQWFLEVVPTRLSNPEKSAILVIQQRTHEDDVSGTILAHELNYEHLLIQMEFEPTTICQTSIGWVDPRALTITDDGGARFLTPQELDDAAGTLAWPERFPRHVVDELKTPLGEYGCTPADAPILMKDLSFRPISEVVPGDEVIGFTVDTMPEDGRDVKFSRKKLIVSVIKNKFVYENANMVKITFDSGRTLRCTPDHQWLNDRAGLESRQNYRGYTRPVYRPAAIGHKLTRICDDSLTHLTVEQERLAGWVAGFFDGDGRVSITKKNPQVSQNPTQIHFFQGAGRNLKLCSFLENALNKLEFEYSYLESTRSDKNKETTWPYRQYTLNGKILPLNQRFLHIIRPVKWRERLEEGALGAKFVYKYEKIVSIEPDGKDTVYALETTSGNYVVYGIASSNSAGQLQQRPAPRGGGIFKTDWWQTWPREGAPDSEKTSRQMPPFEFVIASIDTAYTEKEENDYSAMTIWGVFRDTGISEEVHTGDGEHGLRRVPMDDGHPKIMLCYGWKRRVQLHGPKPEIPGGVSEHEWNTSPRWRKEREKSWGLVEWTVDMCRRYRVDLVLVEAKANGLDLVHELQRLYAKEDWGIIPINPRGDKVSRAHQVVHLWSNGQVYAPMLYNESEERWGHPAWCEMVINDMAVFPKGSSRDVTDSATQAMQWLRTSGFALRSEETDSRLDGHGRPKSRGALYET